jgi:hypothetical protein
MWPLLTRFRYANDPMGRLPTVPTTPASSNASRAAERWGALPFCGQPFGMIQRRVSRDVTSMTSVRVLLDLYGKAAYWTRVTAGTPLDRTY